MKVPLQEERVLYPANTYKCLRVPSRHFTKIIVCSHASFHFSCSVPAWFQVVDVCDDTGGSATGFGAEQRHERGVGRGVGGGGGSSALAGKRVHSEQLRLALVFGGILGGQVRG